MPGILTADFFIGAHFGGFRDAMPSPLLLDMAIHTFDAARYLSGADPLAVYCDEFNPAWSWYAGNACATAIFEMTGGLRYVYRVQVPMAARPRGRPSGARLACAAAPPGMATPRRWPRLWPAIPACAPNRAAHSRARTPARRPGSPGRCATSSTHCAPALRPWASATTTSKAWLRWCSLHRVGRRRPARADRPGINKIIR